MVDHELRYSLYNNKIITIIYLKGVELTQRKIKVIKIDDNLVKAIDLNRQGIRIFKKDNILATMYDNVICKSNRSENHHTYSGS